MVSDMPITLAHLFGFGLASLLYGAYACTFAITIRFLALRKRTSKSRVVFSAMLGLFLTTTTTIVLCVIDNYNGFYKYRNSPGTDVYFTNPYNGIRVTKDLLLLAAALMADGLICWRLYVIWSRNYRVLIVPGVILFAEAVVGLLTVGFEYHEVIRPDGRFRMVFRAGSVVICVCSAIVNILVTTLIVARLWWVGRRLEDLTDRSKYLRIIRALIESGFIYTATIVVFFVCVVSELHGVYILVDYIVTLAVAIAPTLIVLQLNYSTSQASAEDGGGAVQSTNIRFHSPSIRAEVDDDLSMQASPDYDFDFDHHSPSRTYHPDRYTSHPTSSLRSVVKRRQRHPHALSDSFELDLAQMSASSLATHRSPGSSRIGGAKGRLRTSTSHPSFPIGLGYSDISLPGRENWLSLSHAIERGMPPRRSSDARGIPMDEVGTAPSTTAGGDFEPAELIPPLPSAPLPSPTLASRPSITFAERARSSVREWPSEEGIELTRMG